MPLLLQYAKSYAFKSESYNMLYILKQSSVLAVKSIMEIDAKNLDTFLTVKHSILNKIVQFKTC